MPYLGTAVPSPLFELMSVFRRGVILAYCSMRNRTRRCLKENCKMVRLRHRLTKADIERRKD